MLPPFFQIEYSLWKAAESQIFYKEWEWTFLNWDDLSEEELKASLRLTAKRVDLRAVFMEAKSIFKEMRKDGTLDQAADGTDINPEDDP